jgi:hypothetical protein
MGGGKKDGKKGGGNLTPSGEVVTISRPSLRFLLRVRSQQFVHLSATASKVWTAADERVQLWSLFGEPLSERDAAELVSHGPEMLDFLRPRLAEPVHTGVMNYMSRNMERMRQYFGGDDDEGDATKTRAQPVAALVDLFSLRDVAEIAVNCTTALRVAFTMKERRAEIIWRLRSSHRVGAHPVFLSASLRRKEDEYKVGVAIDVHLLTVIEEDGGQLAALEAQVLYGGSDAYDYVRLTREGTDAHPKARATTISSAGRKVVEATEAQLRGDREALEPVLEDLLSGDDNLLEVANKFLFKKR